MLQLFVSDAQTVLPPQTRSLGSKRGPVRERASGRKDESRVNLVPLRHCILRIKPGYGFSRRRVEIVVVEIMNVEDFN
jgi:hypothetical protein